MKSILFVLVAMLAMQQNTLPPLAYSTYDEDPTAYHVLDFATESVTTIARTGGQPEFYGETPPSVVNFQSPYDDNLNFVMLWNGNGDYTLYQIEADGTQRFLATKVTYADLWSPNGRYQYIFAERDNEGYTLYRHDLDNDTMARLADHVSYATGFTEDMERGAFMLRPDVGVPGLYILWLNDGAFENITEGEGYVDEWGETDLTYVLWVDDTYSIYTYDYATGSSTKVFEVVTDYLLTVAWSADRRWLAVEIATDDGDDEGVLVIDTTLDNPMPVLVTEGFVSTISPAVVTTEWIGSSVVFDASNGDTFGIYAADFPRGDVHKVAEFPNTYGIFDYAWSPDGQWVVLSVQEPPDYDDVLYIAPFDGTAPMEPIDAALTDHRNICVGWYDEAVYESGAAVLCQMWLGMG